MDLFDNSTTSSSYIAVMTAIKTIDAFGDNIQAVVEPEGEDNYRYGRTGVWKAMRHYYINTLNFPHLKHQIYNHTIELIASKSRLSGPQVSEILDRSVKSVDGIVSDVTAVFRVRGMQPVNVTIGRISFVLPFTIYSRLMTSADNDRQLLTRFFLRYHLMGPLDGMFWSMDKRLYQLMSNTELPTLEGFASPLNWNLPNYCSAFKEDITLGSKGNFFDYIDILNAPARIIINPPYTELIMETCIERSLQYLKRVRGGEIIMMLPHWSDMTGIKKLKKNRNAVSKVFEHKTHLLHNYATDKVMMVKVSLIFFVITSNGNKSKKIMKSISDKMEEIVKEFLDDTVETPE